jgi:peptide deformylase
MNGEIKINIMTFEVIPNEQTPRVPDIEDIELFFIQNIQKLQAFKDYAWSRLDAAGLAANQCTIDGERFMVRVFAYRDLNAGERIPVWKLMINPIINEYIGIKEIKCEGCLTWRGKRVVAERSRAVRVTYYDEIGVKHHNEIYSGFNAQIWQHEVNHLDGVEERIEELSFVPPKPIDIGRNEKCPCGSGKKYKQCCLLYL